MGRGPDRFEIVRGDGEQEWHARLVTNGRITWHTENYRRMVGAERAVLTLLKSLTGEELELVWNVEGKEKVFSGRSASSSSFPCVSYVDERLSDG